MLRLVLDQMLQNRKTNLSPQLLFLSESPQWDLKLCAHDEDENCDDICDGENEKTCSSRQLLFLAERLSVRAHYSPPLSVKFLFDLKVFIECFHDLTQP